MNLCHSIEACQDQLSRLSTNGPCLSPNYAVKVGISVTFLRSHDRFKEDLTLSLLVVLCTIDLVY